MLLECTAHTIRKIDDILERLNAMGPDGPQAVKMDDLLSGQHCGRSLGRRTYSLAPNATQAIKMDDLLSGQHSS